MPPATPPTPATSPAAAVPATIQLVDAARGFAGRWLFRELSCAISPGQRIALRGASGSGKSVLLRSLAALDPLDEGRRLWRGTAIPSDRIPHFRSRVLYLQQRSGISTGDARTTLRQPFELAVHADARYDEEQIVRWLSQLDRDAALLDRQVRELSGGEAQILALLRALQLRPDVLLLDEPTAALDPEARSAVGRLLTSWVDEAPQNRALLWATHDDAQAKSFANHHWRLADGRLAEAAR